MPPSQDDATSYAAKVSANNHTSSTLTVKNNSMLGKKNSSPPPLDRDRKFNLLIFGLRESEKGTPGHIRGNQDMDAAANIITSLDPSISNQLLRDAFRLGGQNPSNPGQNEQSL